MSSLIGAINNMADIDEVLYFSERMITNHLRIHTFSRCLFTLIIAFFAPPFSILTDGILRTTSWPSYRIPPTLPQPIWWHQITPAPPTRPTYPISFYFNSPYTFYDSLNLSHFFCFTARWYHSHPNRNNCTHPIWQAAPTPNHPPTLPEPVSWPKPTL